MLAMQSNKHQPVLRCPECGSRAFEIHGPVTDDAVIHCAECGFECGPLPEIMSLLEAKVREQEEDRRKRRSH
jgi:DNA-directed RNA polymerase subunit RPC12/RpoP